MQKASDQVTRASQVIERLRQFVKKDDNDRAAVDVRETIEEAVALALLGAEGRKVRLEMDFATRHTAGVHRQDPRPAGAAEPGPQCG